MQNGSDNGNGLGEFQNTNLINYNFNNNTAQEQSLSDEESPTGYMTQQEALTRPRNTKGGPRVGRGPMDADSEPEAYATFDPRNPQKQDDIHNFSSIRGSHKPELSEDTIRQTTYSATYQKRDGRFASMPKSNRNPNTVLNQAANLNLNRIVLYKRGHLLETANSFFIIEISATQEGALIIAAFDIQTGSSMMIQQKPEVARKTLLTFNNDFQSIAEAV